MAALETRAEIDPLTDLVNRRGFEREFKRALAYVKRYGVDAALIYLDLRSDGRARDPRRDRPLDRLGQSPRLRARVQAGARLCEALRRRRGVDLSRSPI